MDGKDKVIWRSPFERFNDAIGWTLRDHFQPIPRTFRRLMVAGVDAHLGESKHGCKLRRRRDLDVMSELDCPTGCVVDRCVLDVLYQCSCPPYVERLQPVANSQNGLTQIVGVLEDQLIEIIPAGICCGGLRMLFCAELLRIHICGTAGKQNSFTICHQPGDLMRSRTRSNYDRFAALAFDRLQILRQGALIVFRIRRGRLGNGDARLHADSLPGEQGQFQVRVSSFR